MRRARSQTAPTRSKSPAAPRSSPLQMLFLREASARGFPALANPFLCRFRRESARSYLWAPRGPPCQTRAASRPCAQSSARIVLRSRAAAAAHHSLSPAKPASTGSQRVAATLLAQTPLPGNRRPQAAAPLLRFLPCPARTPSAPEFRYPARASSAEIRSRSVQAKAHPAAANPAARALAPRAPLPPSPPPPRDTSTPAPAANRSERPARYRQSKSSSFRLLSCVLTCSFHW